MQFNSFTLFRNSTLCSTFIGISLNKAHPAAIGRSFLWVTFTLVKLYLQQCITSTHILDWVLQESKPRVVCALLIHQNLHGIHTSVCVYVHVSTQTLFACSICTNYTENSKAKSFQLKDWKEKKSSDSQAHADWSSNMDVQENHRGRRRNEVCAFSWW